MSAKVWVVMDGRDYEGYHSVFVFSTESAANAYASEFKTRDPTAHYSDVFERTVHQE